MKLILHLFYHISMIGDRNIFVTSSMQPLDLADVGGGDVAVGYLHVSSLSGDNTYFMAALQVWITHAHLVKLSY